MDADIDGELGLKVLYEGSNPTVEYNFDPMPSRVSLISILILPAE